MYPCLSSAITSIVCCPGAAKICVSMALVYVKYTARLSTYTRMKKIGFFGEAVAATCRGDVTLALSVGSETVRGKSLEPLDRAEYKSMSEDHMRAARVTGWSEATR